MILAFHSHQNALEAPNVMGPVCHQVPSGASKKGKRDRAKKAETNGAKKEMKGGKT
jgi:hypothetical protein